MGFQTIIIINNDALHVFKDNPKEFAEAIFDGIDRANREHKQVTVPFHNYGGYLHCEPSRHADCGSLFVQHHGSFTEIGKYSKDFTEIYRVNKGFIRDILDIAKRVLKDAVSYVKDKEEKEEKE